MANINNLKMILYFINPFYMTGKGWFAIVDVLTFFVVPYILLKKYYKTAWWRAILFYCGFMISQITMLNNPITEYVLEIGGIFLMIGACIWKNEKTKNKLPNNKEKQNLN